MLNWRTLPMHRKALLLLGALGVVLFMFAVSLVDDTEQKAESGGNEQFSFVGSLAEAPVDGRPEFVDVTTPPGASREILTRVAFRLQRKRLTGSVVGIATLVQGSEGAYVRGTRGIPNDATQRISRTEFVNGRATLAMELTPGYYKVEFVAPNAETLLTLIEVRSGECHILPPREVPLNLWQPYLLLREGGQGKQILWHPREITRPYGFYEVHTAVSVEDASLDLRECTRVRIAALGESGHPINLALDASVYWESASDKHPSGLGFRADFRALGASDAVTASASDPWEKSAFAKSADGSTKQHGILVPWRSEVTATLTDRFVQQYRVRQLDAVVHDVVPEIDEYTLKFNLDGMRTYFVDVQDNLGNRLTESVVEFTLHDDASNHEKIRIGKYLEDHGCFTSWAHREQRVLRAVAVDPLIGEASFVPDSTTSAMTPQVVKVTTYTDVLNLSVVDSAGTLVDASAACLAVSMRSVRGHNAPLRRFGMERVIPFGVGELRRPAEVMVSLELRVTGYTVAPISVTRSPGDSTPVVFTVTKSELLQVYVIPPASVNIQDSDILFVGASDGAGIGDTKLVYLSKLKRSASLRRAGAWDSAVPFQLYTGHPPRSATAYLQSADGVIYSGWASAAGGSATVELKAVELSDGWTLENHSRSTLRGDIVVTKDPIAPQLSGMLSEEVRDVLATVREHGREPLLSDMGRAFLAFPQTRWGFSLGDKVILPDPIDQESWYVYVSSEGAVLSAMLDASRRVIVVKDLAYAARVSGSVVLEERLRDAVSKLGPVTFEGVVQAFLCDPKDRATTLSRTFFVRVKSDGTFEFPSLLPGNYRLLFMGDGFVKLGKAGSQSLFPDCSDIIDITCGQGEQVADIQIVQTVLDQVLAEMK